MMHLMGIKTDALLDNSDRELCKCKCLLTCVVEVPVRVHKCTGLVCVCRQLVPDDEKQGRTEVEL